jgi:carbamoyltransferase
MYILGVSCFYHDAAACLILNGEIIAAAQEERFTRKRHDPNFPVESISYCLNEAGISLSDVEVLVYYDKPLLTFERILETYLAYAPSGFISFTKAMPVWLKSKLLLRKTIKKNLQKSFPGSGIPLIKFSEHHLSHAASAYYPSPFSEAAVLCIDGVGEWATTSCWLGKGSSLSPQWEMQFPNSLGLLYAAFTYHTGFKVNSGEYKVMGLAPYGKPKYAEAIKKHLVDIKSDGTFKLNMKYFDFCTGLKMTNSNFDKIFDGPPRKPESPLTQRDMDLAASIQSVTEEIILKLAKKVHTETGADSLCLAGGVALNCVANGRLLREGSFKNLWIQPAAGDSGGAIGSALAYWHQYLDKPRPVPNGDAMSGSYLGPSFTDSEIKEFLEEVEASFHYVENEDELISLVVDEIAAEKVIGWFQGRMEFGPRALGARSIIGDARAKNMQSVMNLKIKFRESFRPFAPMVRSERVSDYFNLQIDSPYMLLVDRVRKEFCREVKPQEMDLFGLELLSVPRSTLPAITHVDYSARIQTVHSQTNPRVHKLLQCFENKTGSGVLVNTSFNVRGEPIVCSPKDAYRCFMRTGIDTLVIGNFILNKSEQKIKSGNENWNQEYELD